MLGATGRHVPSLAATVSRPGFGARHIAFWQAGAADTPVAIVAAIEDARLSRGKPILPATLFDPTPQAETIPLDGPASRATA